MIQIRLIHQQYTASCRHLVQKKIQRALDLAIAKMRKSKRSVEQNLAKDIQSANIVVIRFGYTVTVHINCECIQRKAHTLNIVKTS